MRSSPQRRALLRLLVIGLCISLAFAGEVIRDLTRSMSGGSHSIIEVVSEVPLGLDSYPLEGRRAYCKKGWRRTPADWPGGLDRRLLNGHSYYCVIPSNKSQVSDPVRNEVISVASALTPSGGVYAFVSTIGEPSEGAQQFVWAISSLVHGLVLVLLLRFAGFSISRDISSFTHALSSRGYQHSLLLLSPLLLSWIYYILSNIRFPSVTSGVFTTLASNPALIGGQWAVDISLALFRHCVVAPVLEEFTFRYLIMTLMMASFGPRVTIFGSATLFAIAHGDAYAFYFIGGLAFGAIWMRYRSVTLCIIVHAIVNLGPALSIVW